MIENQLPENWYAIWNRWDAIHYNNLAQFGYSGANGDSERHFLIAYFPLFPSLVHLLHLITPSYIEAGIAASNLFCIIGFSYFYLLVKRDFDDLVATSALFFTAVFPTAYFFHIGYTESLFFALTTASFYYARREEWALCACLAFFACLTRIPGIALIPALGLEYLHQRRFDWRAIRWDALWFIFPFFGAALYLHLNQMLFGDPFKFMEIQSRNFVRSLAWPHTGALREWVGIWSAEPRVRVERHLIQLLSCIGSLVLLVIGALRLRPSYTLYMGLLWILVFSYDFWLSTPRYVMMMFPMFIVLALLFRGPLARLSVAVIFLLGYSINCMQFARGWWAH